MVFIKEKLTKFIKKVFDNCENAVFILFDRTLFHVDKDILYSYAYIPPDNAPCYSQKEENNWHCNVSRFCKLYDGKTKI